MRSGEMPRHDCEHAKEADTVSVLRALLAGVVDYAGLFPPAALDMVGAVHNYAAYRARDESWMLGRFVVPAARLDDFSEQLRALGEQAGPEWRMSALLGADVEADVERVRAFDREHRGRACVDSLEAKLDSADAIRRAAAATRKGFALFAELPVDSDLESLVRAVKDTGVNAKIRTGGVTADVFPSPAEVVQFIRCCITAGVRFKATAGLHHAVRGEYRLTYEPTAPTGPMFGFLNVLLAAGLMTTGLSDGDAAQLLDERDARAFAATPTTVRWREATLDEEQARSVRDHVMMSFGSCSFSEPVDELRSLVLLP
jgi:hypothetical protein